MAYFKFLTIDVPTAAGTYAYISVDGVDAAGEAVGNYGNVDGEGDGTFHGLIADPGSGSGSNFDPAGSTNTDVVGITSAGEIFGDYVDNVLKQHGFVDNNGTITPVDVFLANSTTVNGVNDAGVIYGEYADNTNVVHGFIDNSGTFTLINVPGADTSSVSGVNASGVIAGTFTEADSSVHGFVESHGNFSTIDPPGSTFTSVVGISDAGVIVGNYLDSGNNEHGFVDNGGVFTTISVAGTTNTGVSAINAAGEIVGYYADSGGNIHGFIDENGIVSSVDVPGALATDILGISATGEISGYYNDSSGNQHGFVGVPGPTLSVSNDSSATRGQTLPLSSLVTISDPFNMGYQTLELRDSDGTAAGGQFMVNGVAQPGGQEIDVLPANVANTVFDVGTAGGTDTLWARLQENDGTLTAWQEFSVTAPAPRPPTLAVITDPNATRGQTLALSSLVAISDPDSVGYQTLELWDSNGTAFGGQFMVNGVAQAGGQEIDVSPANVANTVFDVGTAGGTDTLWARLLENNGTLTTWQEFTVTAPTATLPSIAVSSDPSATRGQTVALSNLVTVSDPDSAGYQTLELWDSNGTVAGGQFVVNGVAQTGGHEIDVTPANVAKTVFDAGTSAGTDTLWAQFVENNGTASGWEKFTVTVPEAAITVPSQNPDAPGQTIPLSNIFTISDPGNVGYETLELWDSNGTPATGQFVVNGVPQTGGHVINVTPANYGNTIFDVGTLGGNDTVWAKLVETDGTSTGWDAVALTAPAVSLPTLSTISDGSATSRQTLALSSLVTISDPDGVGYQTLELWDSDGTVAGGEFLINGVVQTGGHAINVPAGANVVFDTGAWAGTDTLWAQLIEINGTTSGWQEFTVTVPNPTVTVISDTSATSGVVVTLSSLVTIADPGAVGYQKLELWDSNGTVAGGQFVVNGVAQTANHEIDVTPANVANTAFDAGTLAGTDTLWARLLQDNGTLTAWQEFTVTVATPTLAVTSDSSAASGQTLALSNLVTIADPGAVGYQKLELWDSNGTVAGGQFVVNGVAQTANHEIDVSPANVANTAFDAGTSAGTDTLWARLLETNGTLTSWQPFTVTVPNPTLTVHNDTTATPGQLINLSSLASITDPGNVGYQTLELWDSNGTAATGQFVVNGVAQTGNHEIDVTPANVANAVFDEGTSGNTDTLWARLLLDNGTLTTWQQFTVVDPVTVAQGAAVELSAPYAGEAIFAGTAGTLQLDSSAGFTGTVAGMTGHDMLDLRDINFATIQTPRFTGTSSGGTLTVTDGSHTANIALLGNYMASSFVASSDGHGGTSVIDPPINQASVLSPPQHA
jgi:hypothetical protein